MIRESIKNELSKLSEVANPSNIPHNKQIKSFVFFNVSEEKETEIKEIATSEFLIIEEALKAQRKDEIREMLKGIDWINEKYFTLIDRYEGTEVQRDVYQWADDAHKHEYERIVAISTRLKDITTDLSLRDINLTQFFEDKRELDVLNDTLDFGNLYRYHHDDDFRRYYTPTDKERKYDELNENIHAANKAKYIFCHNINLSGGIEKFENLFKSIFKWDYLYWSVFCLSISQQKFESIASEFLQTELYYNRLLIDFKENVGND
mgnify:CR=1 FL=1